MPLIRTAIITALFCLLTMGTSAQDSAIPKGWKRVTACEFSFLLPKKAHQVTSLPVDSCLAAFEFDGAFVSLDYGFYSEPLAKQEWMENYQSEPIMINGHDARLITWKDKHSGEYSRMTQIHVITRPLKEDQEMISLLMGIRTKPGVSLKNIKRIYESVTHLGK